MGYISIEIGGSFQSASRKGTRTGRGSKFSAMDHGHAKAVQEAIAYLADVILPVAIALDHELHDEGEKPRKGFALESEAPTPVVTT